MNRIIAGIPRGHYETQTEGVNGIRFSCRVCNNFRTNTKGSFKKHHFELHSDYNGTVRYDWRGLGFLTKWEALAHNGNNAKTIGHICGVCSEGFKGALQLHIHLNRFHGTGKRIYECQHCDEKTLYKYNLNRHIQRQHSINPPIHRANPQNEDEDIDVVGLGEEQMDVGGVNEQEIAAGRVEQQQQEDEPVLDDLPTEPLDLTMKSKRCEL